jgi:hypothetical protein
MPLRLLLLFALAAVILMANDQKPVPSCCGPESEKLSIKGKGSGETDRTDSWSMLRGYASHQRNRCPGCGFRGMAAGIPG